MSGWFNVDAKKFGTPYMNCPSGKTAISVECFTNSSDPALVLRGDSVYLNGTGGSCNYYNGAAVAMQVATEVVCAKVN
jgi:hypothetical protein